MESRIEAQDATRVVAKAKVGRSKQLWKAIKKDWQLYTLLLLPLVHYFIFRYIPMYGVVIAFRRYQPGGPVYGSEWVGLRYFKMFLRDEGFWRAFRNNIILSVEYLVISFPFPIIFALLLNELKNLTFKKFVQTVSYLPHFISTVIVVGMIKEILSPSIGVVNMILKDLTGRTIDFVSDPRWFRTIYITSGIWQQLGWNSIIYLAALSGINPELYEAARIDGANRFQQMRYVTIPGIMPTVMVLLILNIGSLMAVGFEKILLLYSPLTYETADVISTFLYRMGLTMNNYSYGAAVGLFESLIGVFLLTTANYLSRKFTDSSLW
ncbi:ABC transporter permease [Caldicoprobacter faecalis]|uniref:Putative aldouronate transport system permease protein n=1 Tax=Caldicoprobacter faecalis TaxID=937334 RepID=A0A1I5XEQ3_9FIRM|nr:ABC transporter permease subunit [Caldicoprobacter faecalis]SFQ30441.1 putative aldouronate transport system permease protein [Caldicoprobacter faecalis]